MKISHLNNSELKFRESIPQTLSQYSQLLDDPKLVRAKYEQDNKRDARDSLTSKFSNDLMDVIPPLNLEIHTKSGMTKY